VSGDYDVQSSDPSSLSRSDLNAVIDDLIEANLRNTRIIETLLRERKRIQAELDELRRNEPDPP